MPIGVRPRHEFNGPRKASVCRPVPRSARQAALLLPTSWPETRCAASTELCEFEAAYAAALAGSLGGELVIPEPVGNNEGSLSWLIEEYENSVEFGELARSTQASRRGILKSITAAPYSPSNPKPFGDYPACRMTAEHVLVLRDQKAKKGLKIAANHRVKVLNAMFMWAVKKKLVPANPAHGVELFRVRTKSHRIWTDEDIASYEERWPIGTKQRLAFALFRYLGVRKSDAVKVGRQHVRTGVLSFVATKNRLALALPPPQDLLKIIEASPTGDLNFLTTEFGKPFTAAGFGNAFRDWCNEAGVTDKSAHGLRHFVATSLAEAGASSLQLMSCMGWSSIAEAERYTRAADRTRLAASVLPLTGRGRNDD